MHSNTPVTGLSSKALLCLFQNACLRIERHWFRPTCGRQARSDRPQPPIPDIIGGQIGMLLPRTNSHLSSTDTDKEALPKGEYEYLDPKSENEVVNIVYVDKYGERHSIRGKIGDNAMYLAHRYNIEIEGACEASLACCTCHVYVHPSYTDKLKEPEPEEEDMLDMAPFLKENSRLGCQIILTREMEGMELTLPTATRNFYVDGHVPKPH